MKDIKSHCSHHWFSFCMIFAQSIFRGRFLPDYIIKLNIFPLLIWFMSRTQTFLRIIFSLLTNTASLSLLNGRSHHLPIICKILPFVSYFVLVTSNSAWQLHCADLLDVSLEQRFKLPCIGWNQKKLPTIFPKDKIFETLFLKNKENQGVKNSTLMTR